MSKNKSLKPEKYFVKNALVNYWLVLMLSVFPLFVTAQYANIRHDKFYFFVTFSALLALVEIPMLVYTAVKENAEKPWYKSLSFTDYAFSALIILFTVSTLSSDYVFDSFIGKTGRFCGLLSFILFFFIYLIISRNYQYKEYVFVLFAAAMLIVFTLCILNSFGLDPLGMYEGYSEEIKKDFVSTIGNRNIMSSLCCLAVPAFFVLFIHDKTGLRFLYLISSLVGIFAMIRCDSMSGYLGLVPTFAFLSLFYTKKKHKKLFWLLIALYSAVIICFTALFVYFSFIDTASSLKGFMKFFRFNEKWGTHRGYMWLKSFEIFGGFNIKSILLGCGPDAFYNVFEPYFEELSARFGDSVNNAAHNELLNYLITTGALGLAAYLSLMISSIVRALRAARRNTLALAFITPVICYLFQSLVNLSTIIVLPLVFVFISLAENISRNDIT